MMIPKKYTNTKQKAVKPENYEEKDPVHSGTTEASSIKYFPGRWTLVKSTP